MPAVKPLEGNRVAFRRERSIKTVGFRAGRYEFLTQSNHPAWPKPRLKLG
jgi:hypothetical protein